MWNRRLPGVRPCRPGMVPAAECRVAAPPQASRPREVAAHPQAAGHQVADEEGDTEVHGGETEGLGHGGLRRGRRPA